MSSFSLLVFWLSQACILVEALSTTTVTTDKSGLSTISPTNGPAVVAGYKPSAIYSTKITDTTGLSTILRSSKSGASAGDLASDAPLTVVTFMPCVVMVTKITDTTGLSTVLPSGNPYKPAASPAAPQNSPIPGLVTPIPGLVTPYPGAVTPAPGNVAPLPKPIPLVPANPAPPAPSQSPAGNPAQSPAGAAPITVITFVPSIIYVTQTGNTAGITTIPAGTGTNGAYIPGKIITYLPSANLPENPAPPAGKPTPASAPSANTPAPPVAPSPPASFAPPLPPPPPASPAPVPPPASPRPVSPSPPQPNTPQSPPTPSSASPIPKPIPSSFQTVAVPLSSIVPPISKPTPSPPSLSWTPKPASSSIALSLILSSISARVSSSRAISSLHPSSTRPPSTKLSSTKFLSSTKPTPTSTLLPSGCMHTTISGTPTTACYNPSIAAPKSDPGSIFICNNSDYGGECQYLHSVTNLCNNLPVPFRGNMSSAQPDKNQLCKFFTDLDCKGDENWLRWPGTTNMRGRKFDNRAKSWLCEDDDCPNDKSRGGCHKNPDGSLETSMVTALPSVSRKA